MSETPKSRAQEAMDDLRKLCLGGWSHSDRLTELQYLLRHVTTIREALELSAALERVPEGGLKSMVFYKWLNGKWSFKASDNRRTKNQLSPISGEGPTPTAAILAAVEKMEKK